MISRSAKTLSHTVLFDLENTVWTRECSTMHSSQVFTSGSSLVLHDAISHPLSSINPMPIRNALTDAGLEVIAFTFNDLLDQAEVAREFLAPIGLMRFKTTHAKGVHQVLHCPG